MNMKMIGQAESMLEPMLGTVDLRWPVG